MFLDIFVLMMTTFTYRKLYHCLYIKFFPPPIFLGEDHRILFLMNIEIKISWAYIQYKFLAFEYRVKEKCRLFYTLYKLNIVPGILSINDILRNRKIRQTEFRS
jgi:hypothetical protein